MRVTRNGGEYVPSGLETERSVIIGRLAADTRVSSSLPPSPYAAEGSQKGVVGGRRQGCRRKIRRAVGQSQVRRDRLQNVLAQYTAFSEASAEGDTADVFRAYCVHRVEAPACEANVGKFRGRYILGY